MSGCPAVGTRRTPPWPAIRRAAWPAVVALAGTSGGASHARRIRMRLSPTQRPQGRAVGTTFRRDPCRPAREREPRRASLSLSACSARGQWEWYGGRLLLGRCCPGHQQQQCEQCCVAPGWSRGASTAPGKVVAATAGGSAYREVRQPPAGPCDACYESWPEAPSRHRRIKSCPPTGWRGRRGGAARQLLHAILASAPATRTFAKRGDGIA